MQMPRLAFDWSASSQDFIDFWSQFYRYPQDYFYSQNINREILTSDELTQLFIWKNGNRLSRRKEQAFSIKISARVDQINLLKKDFDIEIFLRDFSGVSAIWKIFLLHIINPQFYPIFDQHVYRSCYFLTNQSIQEIPVSNGERERVYFQEYLDFFNGMMSSSGKPRKQVDEALFSFGKFLKTIYGWSIHSTSTMTKPNEDEEGSD